MKLPRRSFLRLAMGGAALLTVPHIVRAQSYPTRPVRVIVGFAPGGFRVQDAADTLKAATETELKARGFNVGAGGAVITIKMVHFEANYQTEDLGFVTTVRGSLFMRVQVQSQTGKVMYSKDVEDQATPVSGFFMWRPATHELQESLEDAIKGLFDDPAFMAAILAAGQPPPLPAKPVSPGRIAGAFATMSRR